MHLSLSLLEPFTASLDGRDITSLVPDKGWALLTYLALEPSRPHRREALAELLWPERPLSVALCNLRPVLSRLRRAIGDDRADMPLLLVSRQTVQFNANSNHHIDLAELATAVRESPPDLDRLQAALAPCRRRTPQGPPVVDSPAFEEWWLVRQGEAERDIMAALSLLAAHHQARGEYGPAAEYARQQLEREPWREEAHRQLMLALALSGERGEALAQYEACRRVLAEELGAEPSDETQALRDGIRLGTPPQPAPPPAEPPANEPPKVEPEGHRPTFVGREHELKRLSRLLEQAVSGRGQVAFIIGEPGSGKTMLLYEFARRSLAAQPDLVVAGGIANAYTGSGDPYLPFLDLLRMLTGDVQVRQFHGGMSREQARRLVAALPLSAQALAQHGADLIGTFVPGDALLARARAAYPKADWLPALGAAVADRTPGPPQAQLFEQYSQVLRVLAGQRPLLLLLDDLQWADQGSLDLLFHLGRRLAGHAILLVGAYRPGEVALGREGKRHPLEPVVNELRAQCGSGPIDLDQAGGRDFVDALVDSEPSRLGTEFRDILFHHTGGNALFTAELLQALRDGGGLQRGADGVWAEGPGLDWEQLPTRLEAVIGERMDRLPPDSRRLLEVASLEGEEFTAEVVARVLKMSLAKVVAQLSAELGRRHRLVRAQDLDRMDGQRLSRYRFRHYLFQRYLYQRLDRVERAHLHEAVGRAMEEIWANAPDDVALRLAWHFEEAGLAPEAATAYLRAGDRASWLAAPAQARVHYRKGLALMQTLPDEHRDLQVELDLQMGLCVVSGLYQTATSPELPPLYHRALELCQRAGDVRRSLEIISTLAFQHQIRAQHAAQAEFLAHQFARLIPDGDPYVIAWANQVLGRVHYYTGRYAQARVFMGRFVDWVSGHAADYLGVWRFPVCWGELAYSLWALGYPEQSERELDRLQAFTDGYGHKTMVELTLRNVTIGRHMIHRDEKSLAELLEAQRRHDASIATGWVDVAVYAKFLDGCLLAEIGKTDEGIGQIHAALEARLADHYLCGMSDMLWDLAVAYLKARRPDPGLKAASLGLSLLHYTGERSLEAELHRVMGDLHRLRAEPDDEYLAEARYRSAIAIARKQETKLYELRATAGLARLWRDQGKPDQARALLAPVYAWFTEGFDTYDLKQARTLLEELT